jgi:hypothetical protein
MIYCARGQTRMSAPAPQAPTQTMGRYNAVSTVDHLFGLFKVRYSQLSL